MSDAVRTVWSAVRVMLGRFGPFRARRRDREDQAGTGPRGRLFRKYVLLIVGLVSLVLLLNSALDFWFAYDENKAALYTIQQEKAASAARRIEEFVDEIERQLGWTTAPQWAAAPLEQRRFDYVRLLRQVPPITELIQLDDNGKEQLKVSRLAMDVVGSEKDYSEAPSFIEARKHRVWFSPVYFRKESEPYMTLAMARTGRNAGVTVAEVNLKLIWDVITGLKIGQGGYAYVVDREGRLIAHPDISLVLRNTDLAALPQVAAARAEAAGDKAESAAAMVARGINGDRVLTAHAAIAPLGWTVFVELPLREALAPLYGSALRTAALLALALVLATSAALLLARRMTVPIRQLQAGAARIGAGELDRRIEINTGDELEGLAGEFNRMAADLQKSYADLEKKVEDRTAELKEALDQQTATAELLQVINSSPGDFAPVFDAMLDKAHNLCDVTYGSLQLYDGQYMRAVATHGMPEPLADMLRQPYTPNPNGPFGRLAEGDRFYQILDLPALVAQSSAPDPKNRAAVELAGIRTLLFVPLRKENLLLGVITAGRREERPFSEKQIALLENFGAQAVIAMENVRLITETREALDQQTATAEVLGVINSSPGDLAPVFEAILDKAHGLCGIALGELVLYENGKFRAVAVRGVSGPLAELLRQPFTPPPQSPLARLLAGEPIVQITDLSELARQRPDDPRAQAGAQYGLRTVLFVPLRKDDALLGYITAYRREVRPFSEKEIALLQNFAAQAVIAMENTRLITETREALEQQTATAEVLQVINSSPGDLAPVFDSILERATRLCEAAHGNLLLYDGERERSVAVYGAPEFARWLTERGAVPPAPGSLADRLVRGERVVHVIDAAEDEAYASSPTRRAVVEIGGYRSLLGVALRKDDTLLGGIVIYRQEVRPFTDKEIALVENFADQAVIAMENARLITETREALEQQTATADVLQVINSSPGDLAPVFEAILEKAHSLCGVTIGALEIWDGERVRALATRGLPLEFEDLVRGGYKPEPNDPHWALVNGDRFIHVPNLGAIDDPTSRTAARVVGTGTFLAVALRKDNTLLGRIVAARQEVRPFAEKEIALLENFAAQAVIAMENARLITETREALEQQTATAEVLQVINSSPGDLAPVFDAILEKAVGLCEAAFGSMLLYDGGRFSTVALRGVPTAYVDYAKTDRPVHGPGTGPARILAGERVVHIADLAAEEPYRAGDPQRRALVDLGGARSLVCVPLLRDGAVLGIIAVYRQEVRPFSDREIALLENFAAQAVIAMENARLITETREALEQQTATAEVLQVINSSPGDLAPVFGAMLEKATTLCEAPRGQLAIYDGKCFRFVAAHGEAAYVEDLLALGPLSADWGTSWPRIVAGERVVHMADVTESELYRAGHENTRRFVHDGGGRSLLTVGLRKDETLLGTLTIYRPEVRPFSDKQIALLENFAAQAVIAMENARLITETREALEQQTATAEVLGVINSSPGDLVPVFEAMLDKAMRLCSAAFGYLLTYDGERFQEVAHQGLPPRFAEYLPRMHQPGPTGAYAGIKAGAPLVHIADLKEGDVYRTSPLRQALVDLGGARTGIIIALRKDEALLGVLTIYRQEVRPFSEKQIALLQNFAAQAVIAMENARLITETREALEQQTATAEVLGVINSSPGDLAPVFGAMLEKMVRLCQAVHGHFLAYDGALFHPVAVRGEPRFAEFWRQGPPFRPSHQNNPLARLVHGEQFVHNADAREDDAYRDVPEYRRIIDLGGIRASLTVPLRKEGALIGAVRLYRQEVRPFTDKQIALVQNFAAQAVIAMENARLITETREALEQQTATAEVLGVINSSPGDLAPVFDAMLDKAMRLCEAAGGALRAYDGAVFRAVAMRGVPAAFAEATREQVRPDPQTGLGRIEHGERVVQIADLADPEDPRAGTRSRRDMVELGGIRTSLWVALRKEQTLLGTFVLYRKEVRPFSDKQIALVENFAAQAVIAMENARLITETHEALEQQTATAEVLQVINSSPGDLAPVFDAMLDKSMRLCEAAFGGLWTFDQDRYVAVALRNVPTAYAEFLTNTTVVPGPGTAPYRFLQGEQIVHNVDLKSEEAYAAGDPQRRALVDLGGARTALQVPLRKDDQVLGVITIYRQEVRPFSDKQIALLQNFAAQAVIAMENARLITETHEALEQQTATAEVLQVINSSPGDLMPVFDAMLEKATRLCEASYGLLALYDDGFRGVAAVGLPQESAEALSRIRHPPPETALGRLERTKQTVQIPDMSAEPSYADVFAVNPWLRLVRTCLDVPMLKEGELRGAIILFREEVRPFSEKQIALLQNFAAQAVIAIENVRLVTELRQRTRDLQESLEYQTATSDVLKVISQSTFDLQPVLETVAETAAQLCEADTAVIARRDGEVYRAAAQFGISPEFAAFIESHPITLGRGSIVGRVVLEGQAVQIADMIADPEYALTESVTIGGGRTLLGVPLLRENVPIGVIVLGRQRVERFTEKQVALVTTFADQAVIAIENARLLNDLQHRTRDLQESLEYQTATSDVLKVISQSGAELEPVLQTLVETAARICEGENAFIFRLQDGRFHLSASFGFTPEYEAFIARNPITRGPGTLVGRTALEERVVHIIDAASDPHYNWPESQQLGGFHTMLGVPLSREKSLVGVIALTRSRVEPFTEKQIQLVTTFADQAVIAIENARLFNELRARTTELGSSVAELKMLNEVAQAVSSTLDLRTVLSTVLNASLGVTWANAGAVFRYSRAERAFRLVEAVGWDEALTRSVQELRIAETESAMGEAAAGRVPIQLPDLARRASYPLRDITLAAGFHSALIVPLAGAERVLGAIILMRQEAGEFPPETVRLMQTLASQSVLAIQNARLFREIADKSEQLALASQHKSQFLANMSHELRTPLNAILGYTELLVDGIYGVLPDRPKGVLDRIQNNGKHLLALINDVLDLAKIEAGQLTLTLEDYSLPEVVKSVVTATEPLANSKGLKFTAAVQDDLPMAHGDARRVSQVLLNLVGNAIKFTDEGEVEIRAATEKGQFVLTVRDTGPGIPDADQERIFGEFQQIDNSNTRRKGGTGLGLAISKRMVEMQGGTISVDSVLGQGSTFRVVLPVHVDEMMEAA